MDITRITTPDPNGKLVKAIAAHQKIPVELVAKMLRYNVFTTNQYAALTGLNVHQINNLCRQGKKKGKDVPPKLTQVGAMPEWKVGPGGIMYEDPGRIYILRDKVAEDIIRECNP